MTAALSSENKGKCRYKNLYPGDNHRVKLQRDHVSATDFINASYLMGYKRKVQYIASMGPFNKGVSCDFWLMIWQENPSAIVMVTKTVEHTTMKCWQYWPDEDGTTKEFGEFAITCRSEEVYPDYSMRYLEVMRNGERRVIPHFNFLTWPDHGVPDVEVFVAFHKLVKSTAGQNDDQVLLVHCSAGVGRTGTYIALDYLLEQAKQEEMVDVFSCVAEMRERRPKMIQTVEQYILLHQALYESITTQNFSCAPSDLPQRLSLYRMDTREATDVISVEYKHILNRISELKFTYKAGKMTENREKNGAARIFPCDDYRLFISDGKSGNYINAVTINGYRTNEKWIATQIPLSHTIADFWQLMLEQDVAVVVQLESNPTPFYPLEDNTSMSVDPFTINRKTSKESEHVKVADILLQKDSQQKKAVNVIMVKNWTTQTLPSTSLFISLQETAGTLLQDTRSTKVCVVCQDGSTRCGLYICAHNAIEKLKVEQEVNIYYSVLKAKLRRPQFVPDVEQYAHLYNVVKDYADDFGEYANFR